MTDVLIILGHISGLLTGAYIAWFFTSAQYERKIRMAIDFAYDAGYEQSHLDNAVAAAEEIVSESTVTPNGWVEWKHELPDDDYLEVATNKERVVIGTDDIVFDVPPSLIDWLIDTLVLAKEQVTQP